MTHSPETALICMIVLWTVLFIVLLTGPWSLASLQKRFRTHRLKKHVFHYDDQPPNPPTLQPVASLVFQALLKPDQWSISQYTLSHKSGVELWVSNGCDYLSVYHIDHERKLGELSFSDHDREFLWLQIERWRQWNSRHNDVKKILKLKKLLGGNHGTVKV